MIELRIFGNTCRTQGLAAAAILMQEHNKLQILDMSYQHLTRDGKKKQEGAGAGAGAGLVVRRTMRTCSIFPG